MADRPIIFSGPMVRALLDGRKTQTRRLLNPQPETFLVDGAECDVVALHVEGEAGPRVATGRVLTGQKLRYAKGDRVYVREQLWVVGDGIRFAANDADEYCFDAVENHAYHPGRDLWVRRACNKGVGVPSIHMPRWASRLTLTVEDVRVERLQAISEADAQAEGVERGVHPIAGFVDGWKDYSIIHAGPHKGKRHPHAIAPWKSAALSFQSLWETLHGCDSWVANPFVVAVTFRVERGNIDTLAKESA